MTDREPAPLERAIFDALRVAGKNLSALTLDDLAAVDQNHSGGKAATLALAQAAGAKAGERVLDIGGGIGGPARVLAHLFGCQVIVLDPIEDFCRAGASLSQHMFPMLEIKFVQGEAPALPFDDRSFDLVFMQHSTMHISDRRSLISSVKRVLRPSGRVALQEVLVGDVEPVLYPTPWAIHESESTVLSSESLTRDWNEGGFQTLSWVDFTEDIRAPLIRTPQDHPAPLGPLGVHLLTGEEAFRSWAPIWRRNLVENRVRLVRAVMGRT